jgi:NADH:ubiquinone oxidoreductase subunit E
MGIQHKIEIVSVCRGMSCSFGSSDIFVHEFKLHLEKNHLLDFIEIISSSCKGLCGSGVNISFLNSKRVFRNLKVKDIPDIIKVLKELFENI